MKLTESRALNRIASYCSRAERCEYDVRKKLVSWELNDDEVGRIITRLKNEKYLDDSRFCRSFVNDKLRFNKWGRQKIIFELRKRQISEVLYKAAFDELGVDAFNEQLEHILRTKMKSVKAKDVYDKRNKLLRFALGRGFSMDTSIECLNRLLGNSNEENIL